MTNYYSHSRKSQIENYVQTNSVAIRQGISLLNMVDIDLGDSVDVVFSNGYCAKDVPIYIGEYANAGGHLIIADATKDYVVFKIAHEDNTWDVANLKETDTVDVTLNKKGKYKDVNDVLSSPRSQSNNIRVLNEGNIIQNAFSRASSSAMSQEFSLDSQQDLCNAGINYLINVSGSNGNDFCDTLGLQTINIKDKACNERIISSLLKVSKHFPQNKVCIYCNDACSTIDYYVAIVEALAGYSYEEIADDYMQSYYNCYSQNNFSDSQYNNVKKYTIDAFLHQITKTEDNYDMSQCDMQYCAERYLRSCGVSTPDIEIIHKRLCKD